MICLASTVFAGRITFKCTVNNKTGFFKSGETIELTAQALEDKKPAAGRTLGYRLMYDTKLVKCGVVDGAEKLSFTVKATNPGWVYLKCYILGDTPKDKIFIARLKDPKQYKSYVTSRHTGGVGAIIEPEKFRQAKEEPADFDNFWSGVKAELSKVPVKELERKPVPEEIVKKACVINGRKFLEQDKYVFSDVKVACAGGMPVSGYLTMPKNAKKGSLPALVTYHGAGTRSAKLNPVDIMQNVIVFDVNAHGIENSHPDAWYKEYNDKHLKQKWVSYSYFGYMSRDTYYFKGMYMRVMRALEYVKTLPEWNGKQLIVSGGSQGGAQVLFACAMDKDITLARCKVPALCDHFAADVERVPGWPQIFRTVTLIDKNTLKDAAKTMEYYDGVYLAKRITCPIYLYTGFADTTCAPTSVFTAYNNIPVTTKKSIFCVPSAGHSVHENEFLPIFQKHIREIK